MTGLVERIERGMADCEDALIVQRLIAALAKMMCYAPPDVRRTEDYDECAIALADAMALRRQQNDE
ncbi:hypothetical protein [Thiobacter aerophilum]|uniref:Uncharacterized protein n=1 Tax=Thiobacter aerophilum TaxID=3121275 RepID=A0ABV0EGC8_9BURK